LEIKPNCGYPAGSGCTWAPQLAKKEDAIKNEYNEQINGKVILPAPLSIATQRLTARVGCFALFLGGCAEGCSMSHNITFAK